MICTIFWKMKNITFDYKLPICFGKPDCRDRILGDDLESDEVGNRLDGPCLEVQMDEIPDGGSSNVDLVD